MNISPDFRERFRKESTLWRVSIKETEKNPESTVRLHLIEESLFKGEGRIEEVFESMKISKENSQFSKEEKDHLGENPNREEKNKGQDMEGYVIPDHYETYLHTLKPGQERLELTMAKESHLLMMLMMEIDSQIEVELIIRSRLPNNCIIRSYLS